MSQHAAFIWGSYAIAVAVLGALVLVSVVAHRKARREIAERGLERKR